jgi:RPE1 domain-containing protein
MCISKIKTVDLKSVTGLLASTSMYSTYAYTEEFVTATEQKTEACIDVCGNLSTGSTFKLPTELAFCMQLSCFNIEYTFVAAP